MKKKKGKQKTVRISNVVIIDLILIAGALLAALSVIYATGTIIKYSTERYTEVWLGTMVEELNDEFGDVTAERASSGIMHSYLRSLARVNHMDLAYLDNNGLVIGSGSSYIQEGDVWDVENTNGSWLKRGGPMRFNGIFYVSYPLPGGIARLLIVHRNSEFYHNVKAVIRITLLLLVVVFSTILILVDEQLIRYRNHIITLATTDELTGLANRKAFIRQYEKLKQDGLLSGACLYLVDVDLFKGINDSYGHMTGDKVLSGIAEKIMAFQEGRSITGRWGGDEFIGVHVLESTEAAEKLEGLVKEIADGLDGLPVKVTVSVGAAQIGDQLELQNVIERADEGLYQSKKQGRGRLTLLGTP